MGSCLASLATSLAPTLVDLSPVTPSSGELRLSPAAGRRRRLPCSGCAAGYGPQIVPLCVQYPSCVQMIMQLFKSHAVMPGKYLPSTAPAQHVGPPSHPHAGCPASNSQLPPPGELLTISPQSPWLLPAGLTLCPSPGSPAGFGAVMGCCSARHPACLLPRWWQQQQGFRAGLSEAFVQAVVQGSFFFLLLSMLLAGCQD